MRALLVQPPVYDTQYYAEWSMPSGLLKVATWLRDSGYDIRLVDCLYPDAKGKVKQEIRKVVQVCSTIEWPLSDYRALVKEPVRQDENRAPSQPSIQVRIRPSSASARRVPDNARAL